VKVVQYRCKDKETAFLIKEAGELRRLCRGKKFIINDRVDVALATDADGVHLGQKDMPYKTARKILGPGKVIGISVSSLQEAVKAEKEGASYLGVGPIFATGTKKDAGEPTGLKLLKKIKKNCKLPVVAIGGINLSNAAAVVKNGADAICAISAVVAKKDVKKKVTAFQEFFI
ncbi:MAG: thiamine phosphate synthase, partial [Candidatus Omnitrophica bacterium]|nr:thiamine phosphate synthase [Candidatus Omnitrophota bacterium]